MSEIQPIRSILIRKSEGGLDCVSQRRLQGYLSDGAQFAEDEEPATGELFYELLDRDGEVLHRGRTNDFRPTVEAFGRDHISMVELRGRQQVLRLRVPEVGDITSVRLKSSEIRRIAPDEQSLEIELPRPSSEAQSVDVSSVEPRQEASQ